MSYRLRNARNGVALFLNLITQQSPDKLEILVNRYELSEEMPLRDDFAGTLQTKPTILQRRKIVGRLTEKFKGFVDTFIGGF
ncbi:hypothetical protein AB6C66_05810 [Vibrio splendidus]